MRDISTLTSVAISMGCNQAKPSSIADNELDTPDSGKRSSGGGGAKKNSRNGSDRQAGKGPNLGDKSYRRNRLQSTYIDLHEQVLQNRLTSQNCSQVSGRTPLFVPLTCVAPAAPAPAPAPNESRVDPAAACHHDIPDLLHTSACASPRMWSHTHNNHHRTRAEWAL